MNVIKFGGSSAATPERILSIIEIVKPRLNEKLTFVFSAFGGVTDQLIEMSRLAWQGDQQYKTLLEKIEQRHLDAIRALLPVQAQSAVLAEVKFQLNDLEDVLHGIFLVGEQTARTLDYVMSFGERLSAFIISHAFIHHGIEAEFLDARDVIFTDSHYGHALVNFEITNQKIQAHFASHSKIQVITGFIASSENGQTTTLGRSGSDYTAAIVAGALHATQLEIWTDVDGMMTADPRLVKNAFSIPSISYQEAMELSHFGAKVIFPATMQPAMEKQIPILIKNTFNPSHKGTLIHAHADTSSLIKGISSLKQISLLNIQGSGLLGVVGVSKRLFSVLADHRVNVILISQASSEHSICIAVESAAATHAKKAIEHEFRHEMKDGGIEKIKIENNLAIVAIVGDGMKHQAGSSGRMFQALGRNGVNIVAIAQGSSERNISVVVQEHDVYKALQALHDAFFLSDVKTIHVSLVGVGLVGKTLLQQMREQAEQLMRENRLRVKLIGLANSRHMHVQPEGVDIADALKFLSETKEKMNLSAFVQKIIDLNLPSQILVDCTSSQDVADQYARLLESNIAVVTPNKKANSSSLPVYQKLKTISRKRNVRFLYETNVGAGLPVINTLNDLLLSGDKIIRIEAVLSGTLNYIFSTLTSEKKYSDIVREAKAKGYTEPDPRDDLSGQDVARKILILARECGSTKELADISVENLVQEKDRTLSIDAFMESLPTYDAAFKKQMTEAEKENKKLRYCAEYADGKIHVGLKSVDAAHPFSTLSGSDNMIVLYTERYHARPMVIRGPGAGAEVTAAGVFADMIRIGNFG